MKVERLVLPISGVVALWREDGRSCVAAAGILPELESRPEHLSMFNPPMPADATVVIEEYPLGQAESAWWVAYGNAEPEVEVSLTLDDGRQIEVYRIGNVWVCEWTGSPQNTAYVRRSDRDRVAEVRFRRPKYF